MLRSPGYPKVMRENRIQFRLSDEDLAKLSALAERSGVGANELARSFVVAALEEKHSLEELREDVLSLREELTEIRDQQRKILEWFAQIEARPRRS